MHASNCSLSRLDSAEACFLRSVRSEADPDAAVSTLVLCVSVYILLLSPPLPSYPSLLPSLPHSPPLLHSLSSIPSPPILHPLLSPPPSPPLYPSSLFSPLIFPPPSSSLLPPQDRYTVMSAWSIRGYAPRCRLHVQVLKLESKCFLGMAGE